MCIPQLSHVKLSLVAGGGGLTIMQLLPVELLCIAFLRTFILPFLSIPFVCVVVGRSPPSSFCCSTSTKEKVE